VNARAIGCIGLGALVFLLVAVAGIWVSLGSGTPVGCAEVLRWTEDRYVAVGSPLPSPGFTDVGTDAGEPVHIGSTLVGIATRDVYAPPGSRPLPSAGNRPPAMAVACGDGTFQTYEVRP
jgi:hypothetical protein